MIGKQHKLTIRYLPLISLLSVSWPPSRVDEIVSRRDDPTPHPFSPSPNPLPRPRSICINAPLSRTSRNSSHSSRRCRSTYRSPLARDPVSPASFPLQPQAGPVLSLFSLFQGSVHLTREGQEYHLSFFCPCFCFLFPIVLLVAVT
jgi:hypothetical protein